MFNDYDLYRTFYQFIESGERRSIGNSGFIEHTNNFFQASVFMSDRKSNYENTEEKIWTMFK